MCAPGAASPATAVEAAEGTNGDGEQEPGDASGGAGPTRGPVRSFLRRWTRRAALALLLLVAAAVGLYLSRDRTLHPLLVRALPAVTRALTPFEVSVGAVEGDWRTELVVRGVEVRPLTPGSPLVRASCDAVGLTGDLVRAATRGELGAIELVELTGPSAEADLTRAGSEPSEESGGAPALPPFRLLDGSLRLLTEGDVIDLTGLEAERAASSGPVTLGVRAAANAWTAEVRARVDVSAGGVTFEGDLLDGTVQDLALTATGLDGALREGVLDLAGGSVRVGANVVEVEALTVDLADPGAPTVGGLVRLDVPRLDELEATIRAARGEAADAAPPSTFGAVRGSATLSPEPGRVATGSFELEGEDVVIAGLRLGTVRTALRASGDRLEVARLSATDGERVSVEGRGDLALGSGTLDDVELTVRMADPQLVLPGVDFLGALEADLRLSGPLTAPVGAVRVEAARLRKDGEDLGEVALEGSFEGGRLDVTRLGVTTPHGDLLAGGTVQLPLGGAELAVEVRTLGLRRGEANLDLAAPVTVDFQEGGVVAEGVELAGGIGALTLRVDTRESAGFRVDAAATAFQVDAALAGLLEGPGQLGILDGELRFQRSPLRAEVDGTLSDARLAGVADPVKARVQVDWEDGRLRVAELTASLPHVSMDVRGTAPLDPDAALLGPGPVDLEARLRVDADALRGDLLGTAMPADVAEVARRLSGKLELDLDLEGTWRGLTGTGVARLQGVSYVDADGAPLPALEDPVSGEVAVLLDDGVTLRPSDLVLGDLGVANGLVRVARPLDVAALVEDPTPWLDAPLTADGTFTCEDLAWIAALSPEVREVTGTLTFGGRARGPLRSPALDGRLDLEDGGVRMRGVPPVEDLALSLTATPARMEVERASFSVGAAPVTLTGAVDLDGEGPSLALDLEGEQVLLHRSQNAVVRSDIDLHLSGRPGDLLLTGELALVGGRLRSPVEVQSILASGGSRAPEAVRRGLRLPSFGPPSLRLAVDVTTADPMRLEGRLTRGRIRADLQLTGDASHPIPGGKLFVDPLEVALPAGTLRFPTGLVVFDPANPDVPQLELLGSTRLAGHDVTVEISGEYDQAVVDFSSSPPLVPDDLVMLVLSGRPPGTARGAREAGQTVALYVARDLVQGWFDSGGFEDEDRESFLDRFEVVSGRDVSRSGVLTVQATYRLREGLARERDAIYLVMERDSFEDYNVGLRLVLRLE